MLSPTAKIPFLETRIQELISSSGLVESPRGQINLDLNPNSVTHMLCDLWLVPQPLWASFPLLTWKWIAASKVMRVNEETQRVNVPSTYMLAC